MKTFIIVGLIVFCIALVTGYGHSHSGSSNANSNSVHGGFSSHSGGEHQLDGHDRDDDGHYSSGSGGDGGDSGYEDHHVDYYAYPKYKFEYGVEDHHTGDNHNHWEHRDGDAVQGGYTIAEPDGTKRIVEYSANKHSGFHAIVTKIGHAEHPSLYGHGGDGGSDDGHVVGGDYGGGGHGGAGADAGHSFGFTHHSH